MRAHGSKFSVFVLEGSNAFATGIYFNWLFFYTQSQFHFGVAENLGLVALHGLVYPGSAWLGGWYAHRVGNFSALKIGFAVMTAALVTGALLPFPVAQACVLMVWTFGMCFTWPTLQSLVSDGVSGPRLPRLAGIYNIVWSGVSGVSYFIGGALLDRLGMASLFWIPAAIHVSQIAMVFWLERTTSNEKGFASETASSKVLDEPSEEDPLTKKKFLRLALLANPVAYIAINTAIPMIPVVAKRFDLSPTLTGIFCSVWFFVRMGAFILFWLWPGWHYRFGFLLAAKFLLVMSFLGILFSPQLWILLVAQIFFGLSVGLIYYSSLYYSMHGGASKSKHGGVHEAVIGLGTLLGAGVGLGAKYFFPRVEGVSIWAVSGLLLLGLLALIWLRIKR